MNARAEIVKHTMHSIAPVTEHISIESEPEAGEPARAPRRKVRSTYVLASRLRSCMSEVSILEDQFASVRMVRPQSAPRDYTFDLRFANPKPVRVRRIAWFWLAISVALAALGAGALASGWPFTLSSWLGALLPGAIGALLAAVGAFMYFLHRTTESLEFRSMHGGATLISIMGGIGSARDGRKFFVELIRAINAAKLARQQPKQQFLRDEMREHHRLRELGVLTEEDYEASKARILAAHS